METPNATLYVRNLDEKRTIPALITGLKEMFETFGEVLDIVAKKNLRAKGQAFIVFRTADEAADAKETLQGFELFDKPIDIHYAKTRSDATVKLEAGVLSREFEEHKKERMARKEHKQAQRAAEAAKSPAKRPAEDSLTDRPAKANKPVPSNTDDYLAPHKILVLRDLPDEYGKTEITAVFSRFAGFKEVRVVPGRTGIGFAEYEDEVSSGAARDAMNGVQLGEKTIRVTFQRS